MVNFLPMNGNVGWGIDPQLDLFSLGFQKSNFNIITDRDRLTQLPCQD
jgi:hypothetical protein